METFSGPALNRSLFDVEVDCWGGGNGGWGGRRTKLLSAAFCCALLGAAVHALVIPGWRAASGAASRERCPTTESSLSPTAASLCRSFPLGRSAGEKQCYLDRPENLRVEGGRLVIEAVRGRHTGSQEVGVRQLRVHRV